MNQHYLLNTAQLQLDFLGIPELASAINGMLHVVPAPRDQTAPEQVSASRTVRDSDTPLRTYRGDADGPVRMQ